MIQGLACNLESDAFKLLHKATLDVRGKSEPFSLCGSLPLVGDLKEAGFDVMVSVTTYQPLHMSGTHTFDCSRCVAMVTVMCIMETMSTAAYQPCRKQ